MVSHLGYKKPLFIDPKDKKKQVLNKNVSLAVQRYAFWATAATLLVLREDLVSCENGNSPRITNGEETKERRLFKSTDDRKLQPAGRKFETPLTRVGAAADVTMCGPRKLINKFVYNTFGLFVCVCACAQSSLQLTAGVDRRESTKSVVSQKTEFKAFVSLPFLLEFVSPQTAIRNSVLTNTTLPRGYGTTTRPVLADVNRTIELFKEQRLRVREPNEAAPRE
ncbi:hypothetical protein EVAR_80326_1 [Eumeta japonica]|uniref:Uncharacterized protein n=1 Tax=Eumeta variegata TaxID=151549 RepID=A0A4C1X2R4_EUMVA|nr:hypothetical protein EVAR_80326_1 [Eumeta japonica]